MPPGPNCRRNLFGHIIGIGEILIVKMTAFFGQELIFDMDRSCAGILKGPYHVRGVEGIAMSSIAIHKNRQRARAGHLANIEAGVFKRENAKIGNRHLARHRAPAQIEPIESGCFCLQRGKAVMRARKR